MNNNFQDNIGTDPTDIEVETLDSIPEGPAAPKASDYKPPKDNDGLVKKILFVILILGLMGGVAYGVYYYLNLGQKNNKAKNFFLNDIKVYQGAVLSNDLNDYGDFSNVDISKCKTNFDNVNTSQIGTYAYSITCGKNEKNAQVVVVKPYDYKINGKMVNKIVGETISPEDMVITVNGYTYEFMDSETVLQYLTTSGGPYRIEILAKNTDGSEALIYSVLNVYSEKPKFYLSCSKDNLTYRFSIDASISRMDYILEINTTNFDEETAFDAEMSSYFLGKSNSIIYSLPLEKKIVNVNKIDISSIPINDLPLGYNDLVNTFKKNGYSCKA